MRTARSLTVSRRILRMLPSNHATPWQPHTPPGNHAHPLQSPPQNILENLEDFDKCGETICGH